MPRRAVLLALVSFCLACGGDITSTGNLPPGGNPPGGNPSGGNPPAPLTHATPGTFAMGTVSVSGSSYPYQVFIPKAYTATQKWPVILFIHGANERGTDGVKQLSGCFGPYVQGNASTFPAIVVFPQIPALESFPVAARFEIVTASLDAVMAEYSADPLRVYASGFSMGGGMAWQLAYENPTRFAAVASTSSLINDMGILGAATAQPIGSANAAAAARLKTMPIWMSHGVKDGLVPVSIARNLVQAFNDAGSTSLKYIELPNGTHDCGPFYGDQTFFSWLFAQHR